MPLTGTALSANHWPRWPLWIDAERRNSGADELNEGSD